MTSWPARVQTHAGQVPWSQFSKGKHTHTHTHTRCPNLSTGRHATPAASHGHTRVATALCLGTSLKLDVESKMGEGGGGRKQRWVNWGEKQKQKPKWADKRRSTTTHHIGSGGLDSLINRQDHARSLRSSSERVHLNTNVE